MSEVENRTDVLVDALRYAVRAPSVHNTQPWRWRIRRCGVELYADWTRHLPWTDPDRRDLVLSCGAALHHLRVALAAAGLAVRVDRLPDPDKAGHLATVTIEPGPGDAELATLLPSISRRHTERRRMSHRPVPAALLRTCMRQAEREGARLHPVTQPYPRRRLRMAISAAAHEQQLTPGYAAELQLWTSRYAGSHDGISPDTVPTPPIGLAEESPLRWFGTGRLRQPPHLAGDGPADDAAELLIVVTDADGELSWLRAGEATSAALLAATGLGLSTTPLSQAVEIETSRAQLRRGVLNDGGIPQLILRVGWPASGADELAPTARRELRSVLLPG
ncbi:MAG: NAD(P)H nitroreductase [Pseudonocardia sp.]|nr:NAD(P)H nitroreductase [Pseudonocardia sp.]MBO0873135.1 NAD(P)H nitroreductase [Pseudonocardia sp.]